MSEQTLRVILVKPSKYAPDGFVERFGRGFMPNSTLLHIKGMTPALLDGHAISVETVDEYTQPDLRYLDWLRPESCSLLALVGVQSHQMHRALDLAALAKTRGVRHCVVGGPHPMTCDTREVQRRGVSFALAEAELIWESILRDACTGELSDVYGEGQRWQQQLTPPVPVPPTRAELRRYVVPMVGVYPARGCPFNCNFCSVVKIAGKKVRSQPVETTVQTLVAARAAGARLVMFTSDNFNKYPEVRTLLEAMIDARVGLPFTAQCDAQLARDEELVALMARAGCAQVFVGVESFNRAILKAVRKTQNDPTKYEELVRVCHRHGVTTHFSNILGFPEQDEAAIHEHIRTLRIIQPYLASFYVLTPIPGTDQYEDFLRDGLIEEKNMDRFDATKAVWRHPHIAARRLEQLMFQGYREFYSARHMLTQTFGKRWNAPWFVHGVGVGYAAFARYAARRSMHPMAGGLWRVALDSASDYAALRRRVFGIEQLELPRSLSLTHATDRQLYQVEVTA
ncbi:MAG: radical SAM protein [bacterium]